MVNNLVHTCHEVKKVILLGSIAENRSLPSSDIDILIGVSESKHRFLDWIPHFQNYFENVGLGVDLFVYTEEEIVKNNIPLANAALKAGKVLFIK